MANRRQMLTAKVQIFISLTAIEPGVRNFLFNKTLSIAFQRIVPVSPSTICLIFFAKIKLQFSISIHVSGFPKISMIFPSSMKQMYSSKLRHI